MKRFALGGAVMAAAVSMLPFTAIGPAAAHEQRAVGPINMVVGWGTEPAYVNTINSVSMTLSRGGQPITNVAAGQIKVDVTFGNEKVTLDMQPAFVVGRFGTPGEYRAYLMPTRAGSYVFRFTGSHEGQKIETTFTCGEQTFDCIEDAKAIQFPAKDPSAAELNERLDREFPRVDTKVAGVSSEVGSKADTARLMGMIGIVLGAAALIATFVRGRGGKGSARA